MIGYDLNRPGQDYSDLIDAIKRISGGRWWHCLDSTWIITTDLSAVQIRDQLRQHVDQNDELLVAGLTGEAAWVGFNDQCSNWLTQSLGNLQSNRV
jgi:hypothetical protein